MLYWNVRSNVAGPHTNSCSSAHSTKVIPHEHAEVVGQLMSSRPVGRSGSDGFGQSNVEK